MSHFSTSHHGHGESLWSQVAPNNSAIFCCTEATPVYQPAAPHNDPNRDLHEAIFRSFMGFATGRQAIAGNDIPMPDRLKFFDREVFQPWIAKDILSEEVTANNPLAEETPYVMHLIDRNDYGPVASHRYFICPKNGLDDYENWTELSLIHWFAMGEPFKMKAQQWGIKCHDDNKFFQLELRPNLNLRACWPDQDLWGMEQVEHADFVPQSHLGIEVGIEVPQLDIEQLYSPPPPYPSPPKTGQILAQPTLSRFQAPHFESSAIFDHAEADFQYLQNPPPSFKEPQHGFQGFQQPSSSFQQSELDLQQPYGGFQQSLSGFQQSHVGFRQSQSPQPYVPDVAESGQIDWSTFQCIDTGHKEPATGEMLNLVRRNFIFEEWK